MKTVRTTEGLRDVLFQELDDFLEGKVDTNHVRTVTKATGAILQVVSTDIQASALLHAMNRNSDKPIALSDLTLNINLSSKPSDNEKVIEQAQLDHFEKEFDPDTEIDAYMPLGKRSIRQSNIVPTKNGYIRKSGK